MPNLVYWIVGAVGLAVSLGAAFMLGVGASIAKRGDEDTKFNDSKDYG